MEKNDQFTSAGQTSKKIFAGAIGLGALALGLVCYQILRALFATGVPAPFVKVGETFIMRERHFDPGDKKYAESRTDVITVTGLEKERFRLKTTEGFEVAQSYNIFLPAFETKNTNPANGLLGTEKITIFGDAMALFPLKIGKKAVNRIVGVSPDQRVSTYEYQYACEVTGRESIKIDMGAFDTYKVVCTATGSRNFKKTFYYEPRMGLYLLVEWVGDVDGYFGEIISYKKGS